MKMNLQKRLKRLSRAIVYWLPSDELEKEEGKDKLQRLKSIMLI